MKKLKGKITICRSSNNQGDEIHIEITDDSSRVQFFSGYMSCEEFGLAVTGLGARPIEFTPRGLDNVGKKVEMKELVFQMLDNPKYDKKWAEQNCQAFADEGWTADRHFSSQGSIRKHEDGCYYAHGTQRRYVETE